MKRNESAKDGEKTLYCSLSFQSGGGRYYYISDFEVSVGDTVLVEAGADDSISVADVMETAEFAKGDEPYPPEKTRHIIRICTDEDIEMYRDLPFASKEYFCPALRRMTEKDDCIIMCKVFDGALPVKTLSDYSIRVFPNKINREICRGCGRHTKT